MAPKLLPAIATPDRMQRGLEFMVEYYHSDMPMAPVQPLFLMHNGVNRTTMSGRVAGENQRVSREGALRAVTFDAVYSLKLENEVGSIVPGKLANFTILGDNPLTIDAARIEDIPVWGTVHEGHKLVVKPHAKHAALGPVPNDATFKAMELDALAHAGGEKEAGDLCTLNNQFAATMVSRSDWGTRRCRRRRCHRRSCQYARLMGSNSPDRRRRRRRGWISHRQ